MYVTTLAHAQWLWLSPMSPIQLRAKIVKFQPWILFIRVSWKISGVSSQSHAREYNIQSMKRTSWDCVMTSVKVCLKYVLNRQSTSPPPLPGMAQWWERSPPTAVARVDSRTWRHMWVEFVVGSRPCSEASIYKNQHAKFQLGLDARIPSKRVLELYGITWINFILVLRFLIYFSTRSYFRVKI